MEILQWIMEFPDTMPGENYYTQDYKFQRR